MTAFRCCECGATIPERDALPVLWCGPDWEPRPPGEEICDACMAAHVPDLIGPLSIDDGARAAWLVDLLKVPHAHEWIFAEHYTWNGETIAVAGADGLERTVDRKSTRLNSSHPSISY